MPIPQDLRWTYRATRSNAFAAAPLRRVIGFLLRHSPFGAPAFAQRGGGQAIALRGDHRAQFPPGASVVPRKEGPADDATRRWCRSPAPAAADRQHPPEQRVPPSRITANPPSDVSNYRLGDTITPTITAPCQPYAGAWPCDHPRVNAFWSGRLLDPAVGWHRLLALAGCSILAACAAWRERRTGSGRAEGADQLADWGSGSAIDEKVMN